MKNKDFFVDSPHKEMNFFDKHQVRNFEIDEKTKTKWIIESRSENDIVQIKRPILFFYVGQPNITLGKLKEYFTIHCLVAFQLDGFIEMK